MEGQIYKWKMKGLSKGIDPDLAVQELKRIESVYGKITPEIVVDESKSNESVLHPIFEWDTNKAAYNWNLQQARTLLNNIQINIISDGEPRKIDVYEVVSKEEGYKNIESFTPDDVSYVKRSTLSSLVILKNKLSLYKNFESVRECIEQAIGILEDV